MKTIVRQFVFLLCLATATFAATKEFTILGDQKIKAKVKGGMPLPQKTLNQNRRCWLYDRRRQTDLGF